jgi:hypothetical protein
VESNQPRTGPPVTLFGGADKSFTEELYASYTYMVFVWQGVNLLWFSNLQTYSFLNARWHQSYMTSPSLLRYFSKHYRTRYWHCPITTLIMCSLPLDGYGLFIWITHLEISLPLTRFLALVRAVIRAVIGTVDMRVQLGFNNIFTITCPVRAGRTAAAQALHLYTTPWFLSCCTQVGFVECHS